eukprot:m.998266 g.998266  ORF g.998266 m.998266 type:complete len:103 (+) comp24024_c2_seq35:1199-1507(+)
MLDLHHGADNAFSINTGGEHLSMRYLATQAAGVALTGSSVDALSTNGAKMGLPARNVTTHNITGPPQSRYFDARDDWQTTLPKCMCGRMHHVAISSRNKRVS